MRTTGLFDETLIQEYSKKIFGFALSKTGHYHNAEDLAQEIVLSLLRSLRAGKEIGNMDAWVHKICCYTWTNYLAKEKRHWRSVDIDGQNLHSDAVSMDEQLETMESLQLLKREVAYLGRLHREISVMYYYDGRSIGSIAERLNIPQGTVKWHLFEARKKIREGMNMVESTERLSYKPIQMTVGHSGIPGPNGEPNSYFNSLLSVNIFAAAYEHPVAIEDIARKLGVASAYIEDYVAKFEHFELIRKIGGGKYQTNFVIDNIESKKREYAYLKAKGEELADDFHDVIASRLGDMKAIGFYGSHVNDSFLLWAFIPYSIHYQYWRVKDSRYYLQYEPDEKKDGGKYIVEASIRYEQSEYERQIPDYAIVRKYETNGIKTRMNGKYAGLQMETWWSGRKWRDFNAPDIMEMSRIADLIENGAEHNEYDKVLISRMVEKGFVSYRHGRLECLVPFFKEEQYRQFVHILEEGLRQIGAKEKLERVHDDFVAMWESMAPPFVAKKDIVYKAMNRGTSIIFAIMEYLERTGKLPLPVESEKDRLTTVMWLRDEM